MLPIAMDAAGQAASRDSASAAVPAAAAPAAPATSTAPTTSTSAPAAASPAPKPQFDVHEYRVLGNTVLPNRDIEVVLYPLLGDHKTIDDVQAARGALEKLYHDRGYATVFVDIPEQDVTREIVRLKVTEGRLNSVRIAGARYFSEGRILAALPAATPGEVPNLGELQKQLTEVNVQSADRSIVPVLKAGPIPGTVDMALNVSDHLPVHGSLEVNNQYTPDTRVLRAIGTLSYNNLFQEFDTLSAQYQAAPQQINQVNVLAINYAFGTPVLGLHPSMYFINSNSNVPSIGTTGVLGKGQIYGARLSIPLDQAPIAAQSIVFGADYKHFRETIGQIDGQLITPISYVNLSLGYNGFWSSDKLQYSLGATGNFGPRGIPNNSLTFANKRYQGRSNYSYLKINTSLTAKLPWGFQMLLRGDAQFAPDALITNEQYSITGADGVRGYLEAEILSDTGMKGTVQLQSPFWTWGKRTLGDMFVFYDLGRADVLDALERQPQYAELRSWGAGFHVLPGLPVNGLLTWTNPLVDAPYTGRGQWRVLFVIRGAF